MCILLLPWQRRSSDDNYVSPEWTEWFNISLVRLSSFCEGVPPAQFPFILLTKLYTEICILHLYADDIKIYASDLSLNVTVTEDIFYIWISFKHFKSVISPLHVCDSSIFYIFIGVKLKSDMWLCLFSFSGLKKSPGHNETFCAGQL